MGIELKRHNHGEYNIEIEFLRKQHCLKDRNKIDHMVEHGTDRDTLSTPPPRLDLVFWKTRISLEAVTNERHGPPICP